MSIVYSNVFIDMSIQLEGRLTLSIADAGSSIITLISEKYILWKRSESSAPRCPNVIPFSIIFPATFEDGNRTRKLPPSYEALFYGSSALCVRCVYTLNITIIKRRPRFSLWKPTKTCVVFTTCHKLCTNIRTG